MSKKPATPKIEPLVKDYVSLIRSIEDGKVDVEARATAGNHGRRVPDEDLHEYACK